ncbi:MAG: hypothetical protein E7012_02275 [Alphaproteobacteria bacterium]|nr:hypothetical protein [Alphaproteobacteria bacterium]
MRIVILFFLLIMVIVWGVKAQVEENAPTVVIGAAATPDGNENVFEVVQPKDAPNPLGNPIEEQNSDADDNKLPKIADSEVAKKETISPQQPQNAVQAGKDFQNTLLEANGRVYDVQSYPEGDLPIMNNTANPETIYSPNVNP